MTAGFGKFPPVVDEPQKVTAKLAEMLKIIQFQYFHGIKRDDAHQRAKAELLKAPVRIAEHVVEETVFFIPERILLAAHVFHRVSDIYVVLEELQGEALIGVVLPGKFQGDVHQVEAEHAHPTRCIGLLQYCATRQFLAAVDHSYVIEAEEAALENVIAGIVNLIDPPGEVD